MSEFVRPMPERRFRNFSQIATNKHADLLASVAELTTQQDPTSLVIFNNMGITAETLRMHNVVAVREDFLVTNHDSVAARALFAHEDVHLQVASSVRTEAFEDFQPYTRFFHEVVLPMWQRGELDIEHDNNYIFDKNWDGLWEGGPYAPATREQVVRSIKNYFSVLSRDQINVRGNYAIHPSPNFGGWDDSKLEPQYSPEELFEKDPEHFVKYFATGFEIADVWFNKYQNHVSDIAQVTLWDFEEIFANYVAAVETSLSVDQLASLLVQDRGKFALIDRLIALNLSQEARKSVKSYEDLVAIYQKIK